MKFPEQSNPFDEFEPQMRLLRSWIVFIWGMRCPLGFSERTVLSSSVEAALRDDLAGAVEGIGHGVHHER